MSSFEGVIFSPARASIKYTCLSLLILYFFRFAGVSRYQSVLYDIIDKIVLQSICMTPISVRKSLHPQYCHAKPCIFLSKSLICVEVFRFATYNRKLQQKLQT